MPGAANVAIAEERRPPGRREGGHRVLEVMEVLVLAVVAVATAWSGFQAGRWDGRQSLRYGQASRSRFEARTASTRGGQELVSDVGLFTAWLQAHAVADAELETRYRSRMTPAYRVAFEAWLATSPFDDPASPPGPAAMPAYKNSFASRAARLNDEASALFDEGTEARETGNKYVRYTALFAMVLFLVATAQRFKDRGRRVAINAVALGVLAFAMVSVVRLPRLT